VFALWVATWEMLTWKEEEDVDGHYYAESGEDEVLREVSADVVTGVGRCDCLQSAT